MISNPCSEQDKESLVRKLSESGRNFHLSHGTST